MIIQPKFLYLYSFFFQPVVYIATKEYKRGVVMHAVGIISMMLAISVIQIGFTIGADTLLMIIIGSVIIFAFYAILVYDCICVIKKKSKVLASR